MGCGEVLCHMVLLGTALSAGLAAYYMQQTIPSDVENQWLVRSWLGVRQFVYHLSLVGEKIGYGDRITTGRKIYKHLYKLKSYYEETKEKKLKVKTITLAGTNVRLYDPFSRKKGVPGPAIVYFHGGGFTMGSVDAVDVICRELATRSKLIVVAPSFGQAPEHPFPHALDQCENVTKEFMEKAETYKVDNTRIALAGDDSGANLAAALILRSRDRAWPHKPVLQILFYPILQVFDFNLPSYVANRNVMKTLNNRLNIARNVLMYMGHHPNSAESLLVNNHTSLIDREKYSSLVSVDLLPPQKKKDFKPFETKVSDHVLSEQLGGFVMHPHFAPLMYRNLQNISKAYIVAMEHDSLRDDALIYARRLRQSGSKAVVKFHDHGYHDSLALLGYTKLSDWIMAELAEFLERDL